MSFLSLNAVAVEVDGDDQYGLKITLEYTDGKSEYTNYNRSSFYIRDIDFQYVKVEYNEEAQCYYVTGYCTQNNAARLVGSKGENGIEVIAVYGLKEGTYFLEHNPTMDIDGLDMIQIDFSAEGSTVNNIALDLREQNGYSIMDIHTVLTPQSGQTLQDETNNFELAEILFIIIGTYIVISLFVFVWRRRK